MYDDRPFLISVVAGFLSLYGLLGLCCFLQRTGVIAFFDRRGELGKAVFLLFPMSSVVTPSMGAALMVLLLIGTSGIWVMKRWGLLLTLPTLTYLIYLHFDLPSPVAKNLLGAFCVSVLVMLLFLREIT